MSYGKLRKPTLPLALRRTKGAFLVALVIAATFGFNGFAADCVAPVSGVAGWWPGDGNAVDIASTNNGSLVGGATAAGVGVVGQAFTFNGTNSYVQIQDSPAQRPTNLTIEAWVRFDSLDTPALGKSPAGDQYLVFKQNKRRGDFEGYDLSKTRVGNHDVFRFLVSSASGQPVQVLSATSISTGIWYHVAAVRAPGFLQVYVNGQLERQTNVSFAQNYDTLPLYFGTSGQSYRDHKLSGALDEVTLYSRALSSNEIAAIYGAGAAGKCKNGITIITQPQNQTVIAGGNASFSIAAASGTPPLGYQWQFNSSPISSANGTSLTISNAQSSDSGSYSVIVTNPATSVTSAVAVLNVLVPPQIVTQPQSTTSSSGSTVTFSSSASGTAPLAYQWRLNGTNLTNGTRVGGASTSSLTISNLQLTDAGDYSLRVTNLVGAATSSVASLTITTSPLIIGQPTSQTVVVGANVNFSVSASGTAPLGFQWQREALDLTNGPNISGATSSTLSLTAVQIVDGGNYRAVVTNGLGAATSTVAVLTVNPAPIPPAISIPPGSQTVAAGSNAVFTVTASGSTPLSYQWRKNGLNLSNGGNISGATGTALTIASAQSSDAGSYQVAVTNIAGAITSAAASLTVTGSTTVSGTFSNPAAIAILDVAPGSPYPSAINVSGISGTITKLTVKLNQVTHTYPDDIDVLLVGPGGQRLVLMSDAGGALGVNNVTLTFDDTAAATLPDSSQIVSGSYKPTNFEAGDTFPSPAPPAPYSAALSVFTGANPNGTWALYVVDDGPQDVGSIAGGWALTVSTAASPPTNNPPTISDVPNQATTTNTPTPLIPFLVGDLETAASNLIVTGTSSNPALVPNTNIALSGSDSNRTVMLTPAAGQSGTTTITLTVTDGSGASASDSFALTVVGGGGGSGSGTFSNIAAIAIPAQGAGTPYPSTINVSGVTGAIVKVTVKLNQFSHTYPDDVDVLLVGPTGQNVLLMSDVGGAVAVNNVTLTFDDAAAASLPDSTQLLTGTYKPTNIGTGDVFSGPAPGGPYGTTLAAFNGSSAIGTWSLYVLDDEANDAGSCAGGWSLSIATTNLPITPPNDSFSSAQSISGSSGSVAGTTVNATKQSSEPNHAGNAGGASVWYNWTAPSASPVTFDTALSGFDTLLGVYTGSTVNGLTAIAANNDILTNNSRSRLTFTPVAGTVYHVAVDGANGAIGNLSLRWVQASVGLPDLAIIGSAVNPRITTETFSSSSCAVVEGLIQAGTRRLIRFDTQTANQGNADLFFGNPANNPAFIWAACHAHYHFQNYMAYRLRNAGGQIAAVGLKVGFCILDVFRWSPQAPNNAKYTCSNQGIQVGWGDLYDSTLDGQWIDITGLPDGNYTLELEANPLGIILENNYANNVTQVPVSIGNASAPPLNNNFSSAQALLGGFSSIVGANTNATKESGEPNHAGNAGGHSVWYQWTGLSTKPVTIDTIGSSFNTLLAVYTGNSVGALTPISSNDDISAGQPQSRVTFNATAGTIYRIAVDGFNGASGSIVLTLNQTLQNDDFSTCEFIGGSSGYVYGANAGATKESGEPNHAGNPGGQSVWYCWTAPIGGSVTFDTIGSTYNTLLAVYVGNAVNTLSPIASNDDIDAGSGNFQSRVTFNATGLTMYHIAVDGFNNDSGDHLMHWNLVGGQTFLGVMDTTASPVKSAAFLSSEFLPEGEFRLTINGQPEQLYRIERSCDLAHWLPLVSTVADDLGRAFFTDKSATHSQSQSGDAVCGDNLVGFTASGGIARFYRAVAIGAIAK